MKSSSFLLLLLGSSFLVSCVLFADQFYYFISFTNNTPEPIGIIADFSPKDNTITQGCYYLKRIEPGACEDMTDRHKDWDNRVRDSMHFYVVKIIPSLSSRNLQTQLSESDIDIISEEDIYARITYTKKEFKARDFCFPPPKGTKIIYYPAYSNLKK